MNQAFIAVIVNIYADEILFAARIAPVRAASSLTSGEWARLSTAIQEGLAYFIEKKRDPARGIHETKGQA